ncbi:MAG: DegV family protein [Clostridiales bacterium]|nr:DegV family protein [Clostridiales bacterium]
MNRVKIITDSTSDLTPELLKRYDIQVVPLYVLIDDKSYKDGIEISTEKLYEEVEKRQVLPKTAAPSMGDFYTVFSKWIEEGYDCFYIGLSSELSATYQAAKMAAEEFDDSRIRFLDSRSLSTGIGLLVLKAAELAEEGAGIEEICNTISRMIPKVRVSFIIDTLKYLHMGGRCTAVQLLASNVLKLRPQIIVKDGGMVVGAKFRGKRSHCLDEFYNVLVGDGSQIDKERVFVTHSMCNENEVSEYKERLESIGVEEVIITQAGTVISSHCGPGTIGIIYKEKE